jgi:SAM-dependent methyltransferase
MKTDNTVCPVCSANCTLLDPVDFNKSCNSHPLGLSGVPVTYAICQGCGFCFAPEICAWSLKEFEEKIYNDDYVAVDPGYIEGRPKANATMLRAGFGNLHPALRHLDYGGGNGTLSRLLREIDWPSTSYDPFVDRDLRIETLGKFDLITAFEVFEHVPDVWALMANLKKLMSPDSVLLFSTLTSDGHIQAGQQLTWWYASPRNGHISLFSTRSLALLAQSHGLHFGSFSEGFHAFYQDMPSWAVEPLRELL